jgi:signal transduction histidine kinase
VRCRIGLRHRLVLGALALGALAVLAAAISVYGLTRTRALAAEALAAQRRIEAYAALSARTNEWVLSTLASPAEAPAVGATVRQILDELDRLVAEDVAAAPSDAEAAIRGRQGATVGRIRGQVEQLGRTLAATAPGTPRGDAAVAFYATQVPPLASAQVRHEAQRRDEALAAMEVLRARLSRLALAIGLAAPLVLVGLYLAVLRPLFGRLASATAASGAIAAGAPPVEPAVHDELGLLLARLRLTGARLARDRARLEATVAERTAELSRANARLSRADSERRRFFADVGHELRTPLTVILGEAELGVAQAAEPLKASFATIHGRALRLFRRIEDLLRIARSESGQLELARVPVDLGAAVRAALADARPLMARAGVAACVEVSEMTVTGDADWLRQVFAGLFENAAKYAGRGASVAVAGRVEDGTAVVEVADTGPGLAPGRLEEVFDRFSRGDAPAPGFGVGLALARWVVEAHGGSLTAESPAGGGLRLLARLPLAETETR